MDVFLYLQQYLSRIFCFILLYYKTALFGFNSLMYKDAYFILTCTCGLTNNAKLIHRCINLFRICVSF